MSETPLRDGLERLLAEWRETADVSSRAGGDLTHLKVLTLCIDRASLLLLRAVPPAPEAAPWLLWDGPDDEGDWTVVLKGVPHWGLAAHGQTRELALAHLGEAMLMAEYPDVQSPLIAAAPAQAPPDPPAEMIETLIGEIVTVEAFLREHQGYSTAVANAQLLLGRIKKRLVAARPSPREPSE